MNWTYLRDLGERVGATYVAAFVGLLTLGWGDAGPSLSLLESAAWAAVPAALSVLKGAAAKFIGDKDSASLLPDVKAP